MRADDGIAKTWAATGATAEFVLVGGLYVFSAHAGTWNSGNVAVQVLGPDGTTWLAVGTALSADGVNTMYLAPGRYRFNVTTTTAGSAGLGRVPND